MLIFQGLPGKGRAEAQKRRETHYQPNVQGFWRSLEAPGGPWTSRGPKGSEGLSVAGPLFMKEEWEFRASARNPKRNKVGRMPA